jgi:hypothetical protein
MPGLPSPRYSGPIRSSSLKCETAGSISRIMSSVHRSPGTSAHLASAHYCLHPRITPVSQPAIRRSMRKNVRATAPAADSGTVRLRRGHVAPLIGL